MAEIVGWICLGVIGYVFIAWLTARWIYYSPRSDFGRKSGGDIETAWFLGFLWPVHGWMAIVMSLIGMERIGRFFSRLLTIGRG